jgi:Bardet-Biedl syndrome 1 protein
LTESVYRFCFPFSILTSHPPTPRPHRHPHSAGTGLSSTHTLLDTPVSATVF